MTETLTMKGSGDTWYPTPVPALETHLGVLICPAPEFPADIAHPLRKNLAYNLQYLEFLDRVLKDVSLSSVLWTQNVKSFVVHGAAVVEAIFHYRVVTSGNAATTSWQSSVKLTSSTYEIDGVKFRNVSEVFKAVEPQVLEMTFDQMSKKVESKKLLGEAADLYREVSRVRKLRNKIHLHSIVDRQDTDYMNFNGSEFKLMRRVLHGVLTSPIFATSTHLSSFDYLLKEDG